VIGGSFPSCSHGNALQLAGASAGSPFVLRGRLNRPLAQLLFLVAIAATAPAQNSPLLKTVAYGNLTLSYETSLANDHIAETVPAMPLAHPSDKPDGVAPEHIMVTLRDSYVSAKRRETNPSYALARISVFPTADPGNRNFDAEFPTMNRTAEDLSAYLVRRSHPAGHTIPFLPWTDMGQAFIAKKKLLRFRNGRGVLFLTQYGQEKLPINNAGLVYTFQGLTDDNAWYVSAVFPVAAPGLPTSDNVTSSKAFLASYDRYLTETVERLEKVSARNYTPSLMLLENVVRSIKVGPR